MHSLSRARSLMFRAVASARSTAASGPNSERYPRSELNASRRCQIRTRFTGSVTVTVPAVLSMDSITEGDSNASSPAVELVSGVRPALKVVKMSVQYQIPEFPLAKPELNVYFPFPCNTALGST